MWRRHILRDEVGEQAKAKSTTFDDECGEISHRSNERAVHCKSSLETNCPMNFYFVSHPSHSLYCQLFANLPKWFIWWNETMNRREYCVEWIIVFHFTQSVVKAIYWDTSKCDCTRSAMHIFEFMWISLLFSTFQNTLEKLSFGLSMGWSNKCFPSPIARAPYPNQLICLTVCHQPHASSSLFSLFLNIINKKLDGSCPCPPSSYLALCSREKFMSLLIGFSIGFCAFLPGER